MYSVSTVSDKTRREIDRELSRLVRRIVAVLRPERIILFGSGARGDVHEASDIDLIVVADTALPFFDRIGQVLNLYHGTRDLDVLVYTPEEFTKLRRERRFLIVEAVRNGRVLYRAEHEPRRTTTAT